MQVNPSKAQQGIKSQFAENAAKCLLENARGVAMQEVVSM